MRKGNRQSSEAGVTLIEILFVVFIVALLTTAILVSVNRFRISARDTQRVAAVKQLEVALRLYYDRNNGTFPTPTGPLYAGWEPSFSANFMEYLNPYIAAVPTDPTNSGPPSGILSPRPDGTFFLAYQRYASGSSFGCTWTSPFAVLGFRTLEGNGLASLPQASCGGDPACPSGGTNNVCRNWSDTLDYSIFLIE